MLWIIVSLLAKWNFPNVDPISLREVSPSKCKGRFEILTQTGAEERTTVKGLKQGVQIIMHKPEFPQDQGQEARMKSRSAARSNSAMKKPFEQGWMNKSSLMRGFQWAEIQPLRSTSRGHSPLNRQIKAFSRKWTSSSSASWPMRRETAGASLTEHKKMGRSELRFLI